MPTIICRYCQYVGSGVNAKERIFNVENHERTCSEKPEDAAEGKNWVNCIPQELDIDDVIDNFIDGLDFDHILAWAKLLDVEINYPPTSEMYPDWQNELAVEVGDAMRKVGEKAT